MMQSKLKKSSVREALPKPNVLQLSEYDITQKIMESLTNACHRSVLFSIIKDSKDAPKISEELNIPLGTVKSRMRLAFERIRNHVGDTV